MTNLEHRCLSLLANPKSLQQQGRIVPTSYQFGGIAQMLVREGVPIATVQRVRFDVGKVFEIL